MQPIPPPPSQFANRGSPASVQPNPAAAVGAGGKVKVLPALSAPVALTATSASDADRLIEELMAEAERDPGLRELSGLNNNRGRMGPTAEAASPQQKYPMVKRPYRTQQDMIIRDEADHAASASSSRMMQSSSSVASRSKSADARPREGRIGGRPAPPPSAARLPGMTSAAPSGPPDAPAFMRTAASSDNLNQLQQDDVANVASVRDMVAMLEKNTKSQSANAYVRKWGCDLISPEPHTKTVTYRRERTRLEDSNGARHAANEEGEGRGGAAKRNTTYNWTKDDEFQRKHLIGLEQSMAAQYPQPQASQQQQQQQQDYADYGGGSNNEFRMSSHLADLDSLLGKQRRADEDDLEVQWPPPSVASPMPPPAEVYREQDFHIPQEMMQTAAAAANGSSSSADNYFENRRRQQLQQQQQQQQGQGQGSNVVEMDRQIKNIQNKFDTELDSLIDAYRDVQKSVQMTMTTGASASESTTVGGNFKGSLV